jgi:hypothetical protein
MNLFARELQAVLERHGYPLTILYSVRTPDGARAIPPAKVTRLARAQIEEVTATLSEREIAAVVQSLALDERDEHRLRAAMVGEAVRQLLSGRVSAMSAHDEGERVVQLLLDEEDDTAHLRSVAHTVQRSMLSANLMAGDTNATVSAALESAAESCERGELWLSVALATPDAERRDDLLRMAYSALTRAAQFLTFAPTVAQGSAALDEWRGIVESALATLRQSGRYQ